ncbi:conjugative transposon protein TraM [Chondrinema litorale]|uniref:conjugative transposon protein TraM n=1 Tax=Chondrinema litorale TaxID=2994555 RepID=UPI002542851C|nr:conjugative transposon protein TraM [Chondrinema litorale]UZR99828.1 conjugative transposon protein TraM [Chondrinema litorale]
MEFFKVKFTIFRIIIIATVPLLLSAYQFRQISVRESTDTQETYINSEKKEVLDKQNNEDFFKVAEDRKPSGYNELQGRFKKDSTSGFFSFLSPKEKTESKKENTVTMADYSQQEVNVNQAKLSKKQKTKVILETSVTTQTQEENRRPKAKISSVSDSLSVKQSTSKIRIFRRYKQGTPISGSHSFDRGSIEIMVQVWEKTKVRDGSRVTLVVIKDAIIKGEKISAGTFLYGMVSFAQDRLEIEIQTNNLVLHAYDAGDNTRGLFAPSLIEQQLARGAKIDAINSSSGATINTSAIPLLQNVTINAAKKKIAESSIVLNAKTEVLLKP